MAYVAIRIDEEAARVLNQYAAEHGMTKSQAILSALKGAAPAPTPDEADKLLEDLDNKYENPDIDPLIADLAPGELPPCCQEIYDDPEHPVPTCPHWEKAWVNYYGRKVVHYRNVLTGGSYFDYLKKYTEE